MKKPGCEGTYTLKKNVFSGVLDCSKIGGYKDIKQRVDFKDMTVTQLNSSDGAKVDVTVSAFGNQVLSFKVKKLREPYFKD
jgi:hypothetical protein